MLAILYLLISSAIAQSTNQNQTWPPSTFAIGSTEHAVLGTTDFKSSNAIDQKKNTKWNE